MNTLTPAEQEIYELLSTEFYTTKSMIRRRSDKSRTAITNALTKFSEMELVDSIMIKCSAGSGRAEIAFLKMEE